MPSISGSTETNDLVLSGSGDDDDVSSPDGLAEGDADAGGDVDRSWALESSPPPQEAKRRDAPTTAATN